MTSLRLIPLAAISLLVLAACDRPTDVTTDATAAAGGVSAQVDGISGTGEIADIPVVPPHDPAVMAGRVYASDFGELILVTYGPDGAMGRYVGTAEDGSGAGVFSGEVEPAGDEAGGYDRVEGYWVQQSGSQRCDTAREGSHYWGRMQFNFMRDSNDYLGFYGHCDGTPLDRWNGRYLRQEPSTDQGGEADPA